MMMDTPVLTDQSRPLQGRCEALAQQMGVSPSEAWQLVVSQAHEMTMGITEAISLLENSRHNCRSNDS
jgi:hypothetical protein